MTSAVSSASAHVDQAVKLLVDAASEQIGQFLPGDVRLAAAAQLLDLAELVERALEFLPDFRQPRELRGLGPALIGIDDGKLLFGKGLKRREIGFDHLVEIGGAEGPVGHAGQERIGPGLEELLAVARDLKLPLELLMGDARAREIAMRLGHTPIGKRRRGKRHRQKQSRRHEELRLVAHPMVSKPLASGRAQAQPALGTAGFL